MHDGKYHSHNYVNKLHYHLSAVITKLLKNSHTEKKACVIRKNTDDFFLEEKKTGRLAEMFTKY